MTLNDVAVQIWELCIENNIHISAAHIPGKHNVIADIASREFHDSAEWMISPNTFRDIVVEYGEPEIDLFASRLNHQLARYASWRPDPELAYIDAMQMSWENLFIYLFPPFSMVWPVLTKMEEDRVERAILVVPKWPTQSWFPRAMKKALECREISSKSLMLPGTTLSHPLAPRLKLLVLLCSWDGKTSDSRR